MDNQFVTLATFVSSVEAHLAKNRLEAEGIRGFLTNEEIVSMAWHLSNAVGEIRLQVAERDVDAALEILAETPADEEALHSAFQASPSELIEGEEAAPSTPEQDDESDSVRTPREEDAYRAWRGSILGLLFLPLQLYVFWLLIKVFVSDETLGATYRRNAWAAAAINLPFIAVLFILWWVIQSA